jgi:hypothetical protein
VHETGVYFAGESKEPCFGEVPRHKKIIIIIIYFFFFKCIRKIVVST